jgi:hypothetical protein
MPTVDQRVLELMDKVDALVDSMGIGKVQRERHELEIIALFDRCRSLHRAVHLLLAQGFTHEAVILGRPLFIDSLALAEFAAVDEKQRGSLAVGWMLKSLQHLEGYWLDRQSRGDDVTYELAHMERQRRELQEYASSRGYGTQHWQPGDHAKGLADKHGRGSEYGGYLVSHMFVHGTTTVTSERYSWTEEGSAIVSGPSTNKRWERDAGIFASHSMLRGARAACRMFDWVEPPELHELLESLASLAGAERVKRSDEVGG